MVLMFFLTTLSSYAAVDLSIGGTAWHVWWNPAWADAKSTTSVIGDGPGLFIEDSHDFKPSSNAMAGPVISIGFLERWSIQSVFTIGRFESSSNGFSSDTTVFQRISMSSSYKKYRRNILKWDSDTSIGCAATNNGVRAKQVLAAENKLIETKGARL